ncbi:SixA phosphatase family protein [Cohaesibacter haloalkalitolerans]|uniref:SixA phosphatase family protein n=1 Tax=Cohaesibacter haloalkalitolerans TaxID=1162980 RepID=UPI000E65706C|nr:histidine phosphatase family protein [Cohaesibacter haloalkalitolerans]
MLKLFLLRHAKSSWSDPSLHDFDRPLSRRGQKDAPKIGCVMKARHYNPDRILCSSAQRTKETMAGIIPSLKGDVSLRLLDALYEGNSPDYLAILRKHAKDSRNLMIVGHNVGLQNIAVELAGSGDPDLIMQMRVKYPTAALAVLEFNIPDWHAITKGSGHLVDFIKPRDIDSSEEELIVENPAPTFFRR